MTESEINILRELYKNTLEGNFTIEVLENALIGIDKTILENEIKSLLNNKYIESKFFTENQKQMNDPGYIITGHGAKKIHEIDGKGLTGVVKKYGKYISWSIAILGAIGVFFQILFRIRSDAYNNRQLQIQQQQLQIQQQKQEEELHKKILLENKKVVSTDSTNH